MRKSFVLYNLFMSHLLHRDSSLAYRDLAVVPVDTVLIGLPLYNFGMADALAAFDALVEV